MFRKRKQTYPRVGSIYHTNREFPNVVSDALPNENGWFVIDEQGLQDPKTFSTNIANESNPLIFMVRSISDQLAMIQVNESIKQFAALSPTHIDKLAFWDCEGWGTTKIFEVETEPTGQKQTLAKHSFAMVVEALESFASQWI